MKNQAKVAHVNDKGPEAEHSEAGTDTYVAPALEVLGTVEQLTRGPDPGDGDVPTGVISF